MKDDRTTTTKLRAGSMLAMAAIVVGGVVWSGCGSSDSTDTAADSTSKAQKEIEAGADKAQQGLEEGSERAQKGLEEAKKQVEEGKGSAKKGIEEAKKKAEEYLP